MKDALTAPDESTKTIPIRSMSGSMASIGNMLPAFDDVNFWLAANIILFLYVGILQLVFKYGPGTFLSGGAILIAVIYLVLWRMRGSNKGMANMWLMIISGLAILGDLIVIAVVAGGSFSGTSALLDFVGLMLFRKASKEYRG
jgi:hypothetical protein